MQGEGCREADNQASWSSAGEKVEWVDSWPKHPAGHAGWCVYWGGVSLSLCSIVTGAYTKFNFTALPQTSLLG